MGKNIIHTALNNTEHWYTMWSKKKVIKFLL